jgi:hypothetical protein
MMGRCAWCRLVAAIRLRRRPVRWMPIYDADGKGIGRIPIYKARRTTRSGG